MRTRDGAIFKGDDLGSSRPERDRQTGGERHTVRGPDGVIFSGEEKGYVDPKGKIRRPDGVILRGDVVANTEDHKVRGLDGAIFRGTEWGYVDEKGNIRQRDGILFKGRIIGHARGPHPEKALAHFVFRFDDLTKDLDRLETKERDAPDHPALPEWVDRLVDKARDYDALGDFETLIRRANGLKDRVRARHAKNLDRKRALVKEAESLSHSTDWKAAGARLREVHTQWKEAGRIPRSDAERLWDALKTATDRFRTRRQQHFDALAAKREANLRAKQQLAARAESLAGSSDWKTTGVEMKALMAKWKEAGPVPKEHKEAIWNRFSTARQRFYDRRRKHFEQLDHERQVNLAAKRQLVARAQALSSSTDWKATGEEMKRLMARWKATGPAPREHEEAVWGAFQKARQAFYDRRSRHFEAKDRELARNLEAKEALCREAERLASASDPYDAVAAYKALQARWKGIGHVPRDSADALWSRFRGAGDTVFANRNRAKEEKQRAWRSKMAEALSRKVEQRDRLIESIAHDVHLISQWEAKISSLRPGGRAGEIRDALESKIDSVRSKIRSKLQRVEDLSDSIRDIRSKL